MDIRIRYPESLTAAAFEATAESEGGFVVPFQEKDGHSLAVYNTQAAYPNTLEQINPNLFQGDEGWVELAHDGAAGDLTYPREFDGEYVLTFTMTATAGTLTVGRNVFDTAGTYTLALDGPLVFEADADYVGELSDISVKAVKDKKLWGIAVGRFNLYPRRSGTFLNGAYLIRGINHIISPLLGSVAVLVHMDGSVNQPFLYQSDPGNYISITVNPDKTVTGSYSGDDVAVDVQSDPLDDGDHLIGFTWDYENDAISLWVDGVEVDTGDTLSEGSTADYPTEITGDGIVSWLGVFHTFLASYDDLVQACDI